MPAILLLEDDETITFGIRTALDRAGYQTVCCKTLAEAQGALSPSVQLVLLDLNLPDGSGYDFCRSVKATGDIPVIFLTVRDDEKDIVQGLDMGADDYIVKPFQLSVLLSRIKAVLRRSSTRPDSLLCCGDIRLDAEATRVWVGEQEVTLTASEYRLLHALLLHKNRTMTRTVLLEQLWDVDGAFVNDNTLTVTMKRLREKLGNPDSVRTLRGIGYRLEEPA